MASNGPGCAFRRNLTSRHTLRLAVLKLSDEVTPAGSVPGLNELHVQPPLVEHEHHIAALHFGALDGLDVAERPHAAKDALDVQAIEVLDDRAVRAYAAHSLHLKRRVRELRELRRAGIV